MDANDDLPQVISGTRRQIRETVDNSLEVRILIDPRFKADFHRLFPSIDTPVALAPLVKDFERRPATLPEQKGGPICRWLGARCEESSFWAFLNDYVRSPDNPEIWDAAAAADLVRRVCGVSTRAHIDHDPKARDQFERVIRKPYMQFING